MHKDTVDWTKPKLWIGIGALICAAYVALGAFGSHGLKPKLSSSNIDTYNTSLRYLIIHGIGLLTVNLSFIILHKYNKWVNRLLVLGCVLFSGGLLVHALKDLLNIGVNVFAMIAPIGGLCFIAGWLLYASIILRSK